MYICQHPENTRVGANCNSPFHMGEFEMWMNFATWMNFAIWDKFAIWMNCNMGELHHILRLFADFAPTTESKIPDFQ